MIQTYPGTLQSKNLSAVTDILDSRVHVWWELVNIKVIVHYIGSYLVDIVWVELVHISIIHCWWLSEALLLWQCG